LGCAFESKHLLWNNVIGFCNYAYYKIQGPNAFATLRSEATAGAQCPPWRIPAVERSPKIVPAAPAVRGIATIPDRLIFGNSRAQG
jgi:hypothetical protein